MPDSVVIPLAEWLAEARRRFGDDPKHWKFQCPVCGNVQTLVDFEKIGQEPQSAYQECIGRHLPDRASNLAGTPGKNGQKSPCDFAAYGLFQFGRKVINESGKAVPVFPFADASPADSNAPGVDGVAAGVPPLASSAALAPIKTITASLEGIKIEVYTDRAERYLMHYNPQRWARLFNLPLPAHDLTPLLLGINPSDQLAVIAAVAEAEARRMTRESTK